jgi:hypothetical protein
LRHVRFDANRHLYRQNMTGTGDSAYGGLVHPQYWLVIVFRTFPTHWRLYTTSILKVRTEGEDLE